MSEKERISATVDPVVAEYLSDETINTSGLVNRAVKREMGILDDSNDDLLKFRLEQVQETAEDLEERANRKRDVAERLEKKLEQQERQEDEMVREAVEKIPDHLWDVENAAIENYAEKAGITPEELLDRMEGL